MAGPDYYKRGNADVWDFIRQQGLNFHLGNAIKYICRAGHKESYANDLKKAIHYLQNELENAECKNLPRYDTDDLFVFTGSGVPGGVRDTQFLETAGSNKAEKSYS
tara:strand:- start:314 stop:631 length:318 start_codon:yes stop_codon:yes gene_type:complete